MKRFFLIAAILLAAGLITTLVRAGAGYNPILQSAPLAYNEAQVIYLANQERANVGLPPLHTNAELTNASRWFTWDSVANRPAGFCDHTDSNGNDASQRAVAFGYLGNSGAEDAYCGYVTPQDAINGWMASKGHRDNLLDPNSREAGAGYYLDSNSGHGFVALDFGEDPGYAPVVIENEALDTPSRAVQLYIYDRKPLDTFKGLGPAVEMQVSNDACFSGASWETYTAVKNWNLSAGADGWRTVYVRTRDALGRVLSASDMIYYGSGFSADQISLRQFSSTSPIAHLVGLDSGGLPLMQFSQGWLADDLINTFTLLDGTGERIQDPAAWGGTAYRLDSSGSSAWLWTTDFFKETQMTAFVRLKVDDNRSTGEVARFSITGGGTRALKGTDFHAPGQYQEFALPFTFPQNEEFLILNFSRGGDTAVTIDAVTFFSAPVGFHETYDWPVPGGDYRGQGIWVRYTDGSGNFSPFVLAGTTGYALSVKPEELYLLAARDHSTDERASLNVLASCLQNGWQVQSDASWLEVWADGDLIQVRVHPDELANGDYRSQIRIHPSDGQAEVIVPVVLRVVAHADLTYFPLIR